MNNIDYISIFKRDPEKYISVAVEAFKVVKIDYLSSIEAYILTHEDNSKSKFTITNENCKEIISIFKEKSDILKNGIIDIINSTYNQVKEANDKVVSLKNHINNPITLIKLIDQVKISELNINPTFIKLIKRMRVDGDFYYYPDSGEFYNIPGIHSKRMINIYTITDNDFDIKLKELIQSIIETNNLIIDEELYILDKHAYKINFVTIQSHCEQHLY